MKRYYIDAYGQQFHGEKIVSLNGNTAILSNGLRYTMDSETADEIADHIKAEMVAYKMKSPNLIRPVA